MVVTSRITQVAVEVFSSDSSDSRITQVAVEVFGPRARPSRITQVAVEVFSLRKACIIPPCAYHVIEQVGRQTHRFTTLWEIERTDGQFFYFTDHCGSLEFEGSDYTPTGGPDATAREHVSGGGEHTAELTGAMVVGGAELGDLEAAKWDGAKVTERIVDWRYPWNGCFRKHRWYLREVKWDGERWTAQLGGIASQHQKKRGSGYYRACTNDLGDGFGDATHPGCKYDLASNLETGTVSALITANRTFRATGLTAAFGDSYFTDGNLVWLTGANAGKASDIKASEELALSYELEVFLTLPDAVAIGDTFTLGPGCDKTIADCTFFVQILNRRAFDFMPGEDGLKVNPLDI